MNDPRQKTNYMYVSYPCKFFLLTYHATLEEYCWLCVSHMFIVFFKHMCLVVLCPGLIHVADSPFFKVHSDMDSV